MPPRRRGKATTARAAAIQAVQRKRRAQGHNNNNDTTGNEDDNDDDRHHHHLSHSHSCMGNNSIKDGNHLSGSTTNNNTTSNTSSTICSGGHHHNHNHLHNRHHNLHHSHNCATGIISNINRNIKRRGRKRSHQDEEDDDDFSSDNEEDYDDDDDDNGVDDDDDDGDDDCPPPLVGNDEEDFCDGDEGDVDEEEDDDEDEDDDEEEDDDDADAAASSGANSSNTMSGEGGCLHCHKSASNSDIQVRCDECQAYICQTCHWCHEFQANHEIRVCDRCDAFYCRTCDEMDQCDDCGEVVCASCSTLLSCKFCGGGLCEECATACGRCGIVLCSRDAKFAVDCDTCRLSYCLVCLASGSKDPCVRCGHRPSKRMEQLVHLRLKSIYKAFKQSSRNSKYGSGGGSGGGGGGNCSGEGGTGGEDDDDDDDADDMDDDDDDDNSDGEKSGDPQSLLQAAASAASKHCGGGRPSSGSRQHHHHHHSPHHSSTSNSNKRSTSTSASTAASRDQQAKEMVDKYMAEKEKADAAAAALLAELEEEEEAMKSKKNKKKRKKERQQAKKEEDTKNDEPSVEFPSHRSKQDKQLPQEKEQQSNHSQKDTKQEQSDQTDDDSDIEIIDIAKPFSAARKGEKADGETGKESKKKKKNPKAQASENNDDNSNKTPDEPMAGGTKNRSSEAATVTEQGEETQNDPIEQQLCQYVADSNAEGIEDLLFTLKGVPGRATLRKNAKKALKKLKAEQEAIMAEADAAAEEARAKAEAEAEAKKKEAERATKEHQQQHGYHQARSGSGAGTPATHSETNSSSGRHQPPPPLPPNELLRVVSLNHAKTVTTTPATVSHQHRGQRPQVASRALSSSTELKSECVLHIAYNVVGWVIGKGGQRIRDLMEDSGTKVWIDQEHLSPTDPRIVYVSGNRKNVECAVRMIKELVGKAPGAGPATTPAPPASQSIQNYLLSAKVSEVPAPEPYAAGSSSAARVVEMGGNKFTKITVEPGQNSADPQLKTSATGDDKAREHEMTCEACFVPLLIGRRGWTIKHIQDSSGARVDIDQTVTPRKVKISGKEENVETAIRMVRDVLSYPHAQLQGAGESLEDLEPVAHGSLGNGGEALPVPESIEPISGATLSNTTTVEASNQILTSAAASSPVMMTQATEERVHTPPPSSTINIGDAKSTISASSSLSSTPEPSMASTSKGHFGSAGTPGPLLPPDFGGSYLHQPPMPGPTLFGQPSNVHPMSMGSMADNRGTSGGVLPPQQHVPQPLFPMGTPGAPAPAVSPHYDLSSGLPPNFSQQNPHLQHQRQQHQNQQNMLLGQAIMREQQQQQQQANLRSMNGLGGMPDQTHYQGSHASLHHSNSLQYPPRVPNQPQNQIHLHQLSAFHPSDHKQIRQNSAPEMVMGMRHNPASDMGLVGKSSGFEPTGMWNDRGPSSVLGAEVTNVGQIGRSNPDAFQRGGMPLQGLPEADLRLNAGVAPLGFVLGLPENNSVRVGHDVSGPMTSSVLNPSGRDDSRMVDSLFGPPEGGAEEKSLLTGFEGLSIGDGLGSDMWSKNLSDTWETEPKGSSALFSVIQPNLAAATTEVQHPPKSRFLWGVAGEPQGPS